MYCIILYILCLTGSSSAYDGYKYECNPNYDYPDGSSYWTCENYTSPNKTITTTTIVTSTTTSTGINSTSGSGGEEEPNTESVKSPSEQLIEQWELISILVVIICSGLGVTLFFLSVIYFRYRIRFKSQFDEPQHFIIVKFFQNVADFWTDLFFSVILYLENELLLAYCGIFFVILPLLMQCIIGIYFVLKWKTTHYNSRHGRLSTAMSNSATSSGSICSINTIESNDTDELPTTPSKSSKRSPKLSSSFGGEITTTTSRSHRSREQSNTSGKNIALIDSKRLYNYLNKYEVLIYLLTIVSGFYNSIDLLRSKIFYLSIFLFQMKNEEFNQLKKYRFVNIILLENLPQLVIQIIYLINVNNNDIGQASQIVFISMVFSVLSILFALIKEISRIMDKSHHSHIKTMKLMSDLSIIHGKLTIKSKNVHYCHGFSMKKLERCLTNTIDLIVKNDDLLYFVEFYFVNNDHQVLSTLSKLEGYFEISVSNVGDLTRLDTFCDDLTAVSVSHTEDTNIVQVLSF